MLKIKIFVLLPGSLRYRLWRILIAKIEICIIQNIFPQNFSSITPKTKIFVLPPGGSQISTLENFNYQNRNLHHSNYISPKFQLHNAKTWNFCFAPWGVLLLTLKTFFIHIEIYGQFWVETCKSPPMKLYFVKILGLSHKKDKNFSTAPGGLRYRLWRFFVITIQIYVLQTILP
jgi:hypothetical protein